MQQLDVRPDDPIRVLYMRGYYFELRLDYRRRSSGHEHRAFRASFSASLDASGNGTEVRLGRIPEEYEPEIVHFFRRLLEARRRTEGYGPDDLTGRPVRPLPQPPSLGAAAAAEPEISDS